MTANDLELIRRAVDLALATFEHDERPDWFARARAVAQLHRAQVVLDGEREEA